MTQSPIILNYTSLRPKPGMRLAMEEADGQVRVLFAVTPRWVFLIPVAIALVCAAAYVAAAIGAYREYLYEKSIAGLRFAPAPQDFSQWLWGEMRSDGIGVAFWLTIAGFAFWRYRRWVRDHRVLAATKDGLLLSRVGWWRLHRKWWPADEIAAIELAPVWGSVRVIDTVAYLLIHAKSGGRRRLYLDTPARELPGRIAERLSAVLGCPLGPQRAGSSSARKLPRRIPG
jgi:hypothetical protein